MPKIRLEITFHGLDYVSDRTAREVMKATSKLMRRAQIAEIVHVLKRSDLPLDQYQSLLDRSVKFMEDAPLLDIQEAHQGSWKTTALVGAFGLWFLQNTVGESLKEGWKHNPLHHEISDYVANFRAEQLLEFLKDGKDAVSSLDDWILRNAEIKTSKKGPRLILHLTPIGERQIEKHVFIDDDVLLESMELDE